MQRQRDKLSKEIKMPILEIGLLVLSLGALLVAWRALAHVRAMTARLERLSSTLYETRQEQRQQDRAIQNQVAALDVQMQKMSGDIRFDPDAPLTELFAREPRAQNVLAAFHIGGCADCAVDENESLAEAVRARGADLNKVMTALNTLPANGKHTDLRVPNVRLEP